MAQNFTVAVLGINRLGYSNLISVFPLYVIHDNFVNFAYCSNKYVYVYNLTLPYPRDCLLYLLNTFISEKKVVRLPFILKCLSCVKPGGEVPNEDPGLNLSPLSMALPK